MENRPRNLEINNPESASGDPAGSAPTPSKFKRTLEEAKVTSDRWLEKTIFKRKLETEGTVLPENPPEELKTPLPASKPDPRRNPAYWSLEREKQRQRQEEEDWQQRQEEQSRQKEQDRRRREIEKMREKDRQRQTAEIQSRKQDEQRRRGMENDPIWGILRVVIAIGLIVLRIILFRR